MKKKKAIKVLSDLKDEISGDAPSVEDGYARRFKESIKVIFGSESDFYDSAKKINFLFAHPIRCICNAAETIPLRTLKL